MSFFAMFCNFLKGQNYDLNNVSALPTLSLKMFHKASTTFGTDAPMGSIEIPLTSIKSDGSPTDQWYPLQKMGRMKDVAGEVHIIARFSGPPAGEDGAAAASSGPADIAVSMQFEENPDHEDAVTARLYHSLRDSSPLCRCPTSCTSCVSLAKTCQLWTRPCLESEYALLCNVNGYDFVYNVVLL
jgi:hypothetical protein